MDDTPLESDLLVRMKVENPKMYQDVLAARARRKRQEAQDAFFLRDAAGIDPVVRLPEEVIQLQKEVAILKEQLARMQRDMLAEFERIDGRFTKAGKIINQLRGKK